MNWTNNGKRHVSDGYFIEADPELGGCRLCWDREDDEDKTIAVFPTVEEAKRAADVHESLATSFRDTFGGICRALGGYTPQ